MAGWLAVTTNSISLIGFIAYTQSAIAEGTAAISQPPSQQACTASLQQPMHIFNNTFARSRVSQTPN
eukprot:882308-Heterocapsa_arctica.AAC.1